MTAAVPEVGLHLDIPESVYRSWHAVCQSDLGQICQGKTLAHAYQAKMHPADQTPAMALGTATHHAILQPDIFEQDYAAAPAVDRRTKAGKLKWKTFEEANPGKALLKADDFESCLAMRDAAWAHPLVSEIMGGQRVVELCAVWIDPETGLLCKGKIDILTSWGEWTVVADIKTTADASPRAFSQSMGRYGYHRQAAFYSDGLDALEPRERLFLFIVLEKEPPYCPAVYELQAEDIEAGRREYRAALERWAEAEETGVWPGYPNEVQTLELPRWALSYSEESTL